MEYNFTKQEDDTFLYDFYYVYFSGVCSKLNSCWAQVITKEQARDLRYKTQKQSDRENTFKNSLFAKIINRFKPIPCNRKYIHEEYDLMLLLMKYLGKDKLSILDFATLDIKRFYCECLKSRFDKVAEINRKIFNLPETAKEEKEKLEKEEEKLRKSLIPTEEEYIENINTL